MKLGLNSCETQIFKGDSYPLLHAQLRIFFKAVSCVKVCSHQPKTTAAAGVIACLRLGTAPQQPCELRRALHCLPGARMHHATLSF